MHWTGDHAWTCLRSNCCQSVLLALSEEWRRAFDRGGGGCAWTCLRSNCCQCQSVFLAISEEWRSAFDRGTCMDLSKE